MSQSSLMQPAGWDMPHCSSWTIRPTYIMIESLNWSRAHKDLIRDTYDMSHSQWLAVDTCSICIENSLRWKDVLLSEVISVDYYATISDQKLLVLSTHTQKQPKTMSQATQLPSGDSFTSMFVVAFILEKPSLVAFSSRQRSFSRKLVEK